MGTEMDNKSNLKQEILEIADSFYKKMDRAIIFTFLFSATIRGLLEHFPELFEGEEHRIPPDDSILAPQWMRDKVNKAYDEGKL